MHNIPDVSVARSGLTAWNLVEFKRHEGYAQGGGLHLDSSGPPKNSGYRAPSFSEICFKQSSSAVNLKTVSRL